MKIQKILNSVAIRAQLMIIIIITAICATGNLWAAEIQGVTIASYSSQNFNYPSTATYSVTNLVSNVGLWGNLHTYAAAGSEWLSAPGPNGTNFVTFNLGGIYTVNAIKVWNYQDGNGGHVNYGVANAAISYSTDGVNFTTNIPSQNFNEALQAGTLLPYAQTITLPSPVTAQYIRFNINTNWGGGEAGVGLAKVRFISDTNPPTVLSASENFSSNQVTVIFSEPVDVASATNPANYSISGSPAATISSVSMGEYGDRVVLSTSPLTGNSYSAVVSGVYDEAVTAAVTNNSTAPIKSEVYLWLEAGQGVTTSSAIIPNMVTTWDDQSSYGHNAQSANFFDTLTNGPVLVNNVVNGQPALQFFGTNVLQIPNDAANPINGDMTLFMVVSMTEQVGREDPINKTGGESSATVTNTLPAPFDFFFDARPWFWWGNDGNNYGNNVRSSRGITTNTFYVVACSVTSTNLGQLTVDGDTYINNLNETPPNQLSSYYPFLAAPRDAGNPICIGARNSGGNAQPFIGYLPEVMLIRGTINSNDFVSIENYLAAKYAIAPPVITAQPLNATANAGSQATFWVTATGMQPFSYQWQSNGVPIVGATGMSYTTPYLTPSANGASYKVTISNASGTTNSTAATLTVTTPTTGPTVCSATEESSTSVLVIFSEAIDPVTGLSAANYSIDGGASVTSVAAGSSTNQVVLTTSALSASGLYHVTVQNVQDQYANAMAGVTVPLMPSGLVMWLRADSGVITNPNASNPSEVDAWLDQTANGNNALGYGIAGYRPTLGTDSINGVPAVVFNSSDPDYLAAASTPTLAQTGDMSVFVVANFNSFSDNYHAIIAKTDLGNISSSWQFYTWHYGSGWAKWLRGDGISDGTESGNTGQPAGQPVVWSVVQHDTVNQQRGAANFYYDGLGGGGGYTFSGHWYRDFGSPVLIGARGAFNIPFNGDIQEIMVFSNAISGADRTNIDNYLGAKYFTFTVTTPPADVTTNAGAAVSFSIAANQGSAHLTYQWLESPGTNALVTNIIAGATDPTYTLPVARVTDDGDRFWVAVAAGTATNVVGPATLHVMSVPPVVQTYGAAIWGTNILAVTFQTPLDPSLATNTANYSLDNGATVLSVSLVSPTEVVLNTSPLLTGTSYTLAVQNLQDQYGSIMTTTNLVNATTNYPDIALWLRADAGISAQNGDPVGEWDDQSGNGNNFFGDSGYEPTFVTNAVNGLPALLFDATNQTYLYASSSPSLALTGDMTIFAVMNFTTYANPSGAYASGGGGEIISKNDPLNKNQPASFDYYVYYGNQKPYFLRGNGTGGQTPFAGAANSPSTGIWHELSAMSQGGSQGGFEWHRLDGRANGGPIAWSVSGGVADTGGLAIIGERTDGGVRLTGEMAELMVVGSALSTSDVESIETYLGTKYDLITSPGLGISATNGAAVISWPNPQWSFVLQSTPSLNPATWSTVTTAPVLINNTNVVSLPISTNQMFYRLQSQ